MLTGSALDYRPHCPVRAPGPGAHSAELAKEMPELTIHLPPRCAPSCWNASPLPDHLTPEVRDNMRDSATGVAGDPGRRGKSWRPAERRHRPKP